jgi:uncharacterized protein (DUF305 family)
MRKFRMRMPLAVLASIGGATLVAMSGMNAEAASDASAFAAENDAAMKKMMADMHVPPSGMVDRDFVVMMIPHHQGAIDMCEALRRHGSSAELKSLCGQIIAKQAEEIGVMQRLLATMPATPAPASSSTAMPDAGQAHHHH